MVRPGVRNLVPNGCLAFLLLTAIPVFPAAAQQLPKSPASSAPRLIILPPKVVAGAQATLAVLDSQGRLMPNVAVELSGDQKVTSDITGRALFRAIDHPGIMVAKISGHTTSATTTVVVPEDPAPHALPEGRPQGAKVLSYPHVMAIHDRFTLDGSGFRAAADSNHVYLNDEPCLVVASSPVSLVVLPGPHVPVGAVKLHVTVAGNDAGKFPVLAVLLEFSGPAEAVIAGSSGRLILHAHGATEPLLVEIRNGSPGVIQLSKGNVQRIKTSGGEENVAPVEVKFVTGGNYLVTAKLISAH
jgi:hypothetical protein